MYLSTTTSFSPSARTFELGFRHLAVLLKHRHGSFAREPHKDISLQRSRSVPELISSVSVLFVTLILTFSVSCLAVMEVERVLDVWGGSEMDKK